MAIDSLHTYLHNIITQFVYSTATFVTYQNTSQMIEYIFKSDRICISFSLFTCAMGSAIRMQKQPNITPFTYFMKSHSDRFSHEPKIGVFCCYVCVPITRCHSRASNHAIHAIGAHRAKYLKKKRQHFEEGLKSSFNHDIPTRDVENVENEIQRDSIVKWFDVALE